MASRTVRRPRCSCRRSRSAPRTPRTSPRRSTPDLTAAMQTEADEAKLKSLYGEMNRLLLDEAFIMDVLDGSWSLRGEGARPGLSTTTCKTGGCSTAPASADARLIATQTSRIVRPEVPVELPPPDSPENPAKKRPRPLHHRRSATARQPARVRAGLRAGAQSGADRAGRGGVRPRLHPGAACQRGPCRHA